MNKEVISDKQGIILMVLFIIGESSILASGLSAKRDLWLSILLAIIMILPLIFIYIRLLSTFQNKNLFDIIEICFGKLIGKIIILLYTWYTFDLAILVLIDFGQFVKTVSLVETPLIIPMIFIIILCVWVIREGIETIGKWSEFMYILPISLTIFAILLLLPKMDFTNIQPALYTGFKPVFKGAYEVFIYPFGETVVFTIIFSSLKHKNSSYKIYLSGLLIGGIFILLNSMADILVLGSNTASSIYYPSYNTAALIDVGGFLQRIEIVAAIVFVIGIFVKVSIYLLATLKGICKIFGCKNYRYIVVPISLLIVNLAYFEFDNITNFNKYIFNVWIYYAFLFMVILPIIIWIIAEFKLRTNRLRGYINE